MAEQSAMTQERQGFWAAKVIFAAQGISSELIFAR
jgi:hypothetical protein